MDTEKSANEKYSPVDGDSIDASQTINKLAGKLANQSMRSETSLDPTDESKQMANSSSSLNSKLSNGNESNGNESKGNESNGKESNGDNQSIASRQSSISRTASQLNGTMFESRSELPNAETLANGQRQNVKRDDYLIWEDYFMSVALLSAKRSKDPSTQVGACIVNNDNKIVSIGYNGMPVNCNDDLLPWGKGSENELENKYLYVCHAELNCVLNSNTHSLKNCSIYVTLFPCNECAKVIIQAGIKKIYYLDKKQDEKPAYIASKRLLDMANVKLVHYKPKEEEIVLRLKVDG